jgi:replicative superfamily II helicase
MYRIQKQTFKTLNETEKCVLIGEPTGSGKTLCADFAILKNLKK